MDVSSLTNAQAPAEPRRSAPRRPNPPASFQEQLARTSTGASAVIQGPDIRLRMPAESTVCSGARAGRNNAMQELYAEYTADSTPEDPIVRISGTADSGPYDFTCHIRDIDPSNASYAELAALHGHLARTGACRGLFPDALPAGLETGDVAQKRDYLSMIGRHQYDPRFGGASKAQAAELLALYQPYASGTEASRSASALDRSAFMKDSLLSSLSDFRSGLLEKMKLAKEQEEEQEAWDKLMEYLDAWIESLREEGDVRKTARASAALASLQADAESDRPDLGDYLLRQMESLLA